ncbi:MAG: T9SS type A sorting domain-containing protein, partial [Flavobacteriales bacterium]
ITLISADWQREEHQVVADGQYTDFTLVSGFEPAMVVVNGHNRLNQARMDVEKVITTDGSWQSNLPFVDFRVIRESIVDSSLVRVEHIWAAPDQGPLGPGIFEISATHYWTIDGLWNEADTMEGKVNYNGSDPEELDYTLYSDGEEEAVLIYRPNASVAWQVYPHFELGSGSLTNGDGSFNISFLKRGQYAFANGDITVGIDESEIAKGTSLLLYPVPTDDKLNVKGNYNGNETALFDVYNTEGRLVMRSSATVSGTFEKQFNVSALEAGIYVLRAYTVHGHMLGLDKFEVR